MQVVARTPAADSHKVPGSCPPNLVGRQAVNNFSMSSRSRGQAAPDSNTRQSQSEQPYAQCAHKWEVGAVLWHLRRCARPLAAPSFKSLHSFCNWRFNGTGSCTRGWTTMQDGTHVRLQRLWRSQRLDSFASMFPLSNTNAGFIIANHRSKLLLCDADELASSTAWSSLNFNSEFDLLTRSVCVEISLDRERELQYVSVCFASFRIAAVELENLIVWDMNGRVLVEEALSVLRSSSCIGLCWIGHNLLVLTKETAILYEVMTHTCSLRLFKNFQGPSSMEWILHRQTNLQENAPVRDSLMLIRNSNGSFALWSVGSMDAKFVSKISMPEFAGECSNQMKRRVFFVELYGNDMIIVADGENCKLTLYQLQGASVSRCRSFDLFAPGAYSICVIDNLLVAFNHDVKIPLLYDMLISSTAPIVAPLPLEFDQNFKNHLCKIFADLFHRFDFQFSDMGELKILPSNLVAVERDRQCLGVWKLRLNFTTIISSWDRRDLTTLVDFLTRRHQSENALMSALVRMILHPEHLFDLSQSISSLVREMSLSKTNKAPSSPVVKSSLRQEHFLKAFQECVSHVSDVHLETVCLEFLRCLSSQRCSPKPSIVDFFVNVLLRLKQFCHLHQFLQHHIFPDSHELAQRLLDIGSGPFRPALQYGLDMIIPLS